MNGTMEQPWPDSPTARLLIVGDEVLAHEVVDANTPLMLSHLAAWGVRVTGVGIIPDDATRISREVTQGLGEADLVLISGGIGPTHDDVTRPAVARALGRPLAPHPEAERRLRSIAGRRPLTGDELDMAHLPEGAILLTVPDGPTFGFSVDRVLVFPGVPQLLERILLANRVRFAGTPWPRRELTTHLHEGQVSSALRGLAAALPQVRFGSYPEMSEGRWSLRLVVRGPAPKGVEEGFTELQTLVARLESGLPRGT